MGSNSGIVAAKLWAPSGYFNIAISPNSNFVIGVTNHIIYIQDATGLDPYLVKTFIKHTRQNSSLKLSL